MVRRIALVLSSPRHFIQKLTSWTERMANTTSAKKATRKIARKTEINKKRRSRMGTYVRAVEEAIKAGDGKKAREALTLAEPEIIRAAQNGILHRNTASRKVSRLTMSVRKLGA